MKFKSLEIENFLAIATGKINLADRGLVLIQGVNNDDTSASSNGSGKSSTVDALSWCLYGTTARGVTGDDVINDVAGKGCRVTTVVEDGDEIYTITRHRKHKTGKNSLTVIHTPSMLGATDVDLTKGTDKLTQEVVNKIVGASLDVFTSAIYAGQEKMPDLPTMTDKALKILIEEAAGVTLLEEAYREARDRMNVIKAELDVHSGVRDKHSDRLAIFKTQKVDADNQVIDWEEGRKLDLAQLTADIKTAVASAKKIQADAALYDEAALKKEIADIDAQIDKVDHEKTTLAEHDALVFKAQRLVTSKQAVKESMTTVFRSLREDYDAVIHKVGCACGECGREITEDEIAAASAAAKKKLVDKAAELKAVAADLEEAQKSLQKLTDEREAFRASMTDVSAAIAARDEAQRKLAAYNRIMSNYQAEVDRARQIKERIDRKKAETNPHTATIAKLEAAIEKEQKALDEALKAVGASQVELAHAETVAKVFSPAGVRAHILDEVTPFLNERTAHYLATLSDGNIEATWNTLTLNAKGEYKEKFSIEVTKKSGKTFANLSGGEKRKVRIATALALQDLVATRASKQIDLFVADEVDHALDQPGIERLTQILEEKAKERGSVFVISHTDMSDWISQMIVVTKTGEQSTVAEVNA